MLHAMLKRMNSLLPYLLSSLRHAQAHANQQRYPLCCSSSQETEAVRLREMASDEKQRREVQKNWHHAPMGAQAYSEEGESLQEAQNQTEPDGTGRRRTLFEMALIIAGLLALLVLIPHGIFGDGLVRFQDLSELLEQGKLSPSRYSLVGPLFDTPLWLLGTRILTPAAWSARYNLLLFALALLTIALLLRKQMDRRLLRTFLLLLIAASLFPSQLGAFYGEIFTALCVGIGLLAVIYGPALPGWVLVVLGVANTPASILGLGAVVITLALARKRWRSGLALIAAGVLILAESWVRRGSPFISGYEGDANAHTVLPYSDQPGFSYPFFFGLLSLLFSFGKGIFFYAPGLVLPIRKRLLSLPQSAGASMYTVYMLWISFLVGLILAYAKWHAWYGGWFWGPRFLLFASIPASFALAAWLQKPSASLLPNLIAFLILCLSFWVGIAGAVTDLHALSSLCQHNPALPETACYYIPELSPLWYPFVAPRPLSLQNLLYIGYSLFVFAYLALPLLHIMLRQALETFRVFRRTALRRAAWKF
jgi:hypothetical protein